MADGPYLIVDATDTVWLSTAYATADLAREQIEADVNAGIAAPLTLRVKPLSVLDFVRVDHHPRKRPALAYMFDPSVR